MVTGSRSKLRDKVEAALSGFREDPQSVGFHWRLNLSALLCELLEDKKGWTQKRLATEAGMQEPVVSRIMNADTNCQFDTAGRLLFALGIREGDIELRRKEKHVLKLAGEASTAFSYKLFQGGSTLNRSGIGKLTGVTGG